MPTCKLCNQEKELCKSHIIPEFLWEDLYNSKHQVLGVHGQGRRGWEVLQKGLREKLFCNDCEQHFNEHFEKPFRTMWVENCPLLDPWEISNFLWVAVEYSTFKLFHLSVLFRAHVSSLPSFEAVALGKHAEIIRKMLIELNPGPEDQYPIFGYAVLHHTTKRPLKMISSAQASKLDGQRCYGMMYGGVEWWICVASHRNPAFLKGSLRSTGLIPIMPMPMNEVGSVQDAQRALKNAGT